MFVLASPSSEFVDYDALPLPTGAPTDYLRDQPFVLRAYSKAENIVTAELLEPSSAREVLTKMFEDSEIEFVLARYAAYGCYSFRVERG